MTKENSKGIRDLSASNVSHVSKNPYNAYTLELHTQATLSKSRSETIAMPMICSLIAHGFLPVFSTEGKVILYSELILNFMCSNIKSIKAHYYLICSKLVNDIIVV